MVVSDSLRAEWGSCGVLRGMSASLARDLGQMASAFELVHASELGMNSWLWRVQSTDFPKDARQGWGCFGSSACHGVFWLPWALEFREGSSEADACPPCDGECLQTCFQFCVDVCQSLSGSCITLSVDGHHVPGCDALQRQILLARDNFVVSPWVLPLMVYILGKGGNGMASWIESKLGFAASSVLLCCSTSWHWGISLYGLSLIARLGMSDVIVNYTGCGLGCRVLQFFGPYLPWRI